MRLADEAVSSCLVLISTLGHDTKLISIGSPINRNHPSSIIHNIRHPTEQSCQRTEGGQKFKPEEIACRACRQDEEEEEDIERYKQ
jgi:hypothetical protein